jgi:hypothetical protein
MSETKVLRPLYPISIAHPRSKAPILRIKQEDGRVVATQKLSTGLDDSAQERFWIERGIEGPPYLVDHSQVINAALQASVETSVADDNGRLRGESLHELHVIFVESSDPGAV